jgi:cytochrome P450
MTTLEQRPAGPQTLEYVPWAGREPLFKWFDHIDQLIEANPYHRSTYVQGFWVLTSLDSIREAMQRTDVFSNSAVGATEPDPPYLWIPEMLDPPYHTKWRQLLAPHFSPGKMAQMEDGVRQRAIDIIEMLAPKGRCEFIEEFAMVYPTQIFLGLMGLPIEEAPQFMEWEYWILNGTPEEDPDRSKAYGAMNDVMAYFAQLIEERRKDPRDDLVSAAAQWMIDGQEIPADEVLSMCLLVFMAGLDTVSAQLSWNFYHLATYPQDRQLLLDNPAIIPDAMEEFLRFYTIVRPSRKVMQDIEFHGCPMKAGDMAHVPLAAACRDPEGFEDPKSVILDRRPNNHIAFGAGPHRCIGSHLARRELRIATEEWHKRIPNYRIENPDELIAHSGAEIAIENMVLSWDV